MIASLSRSSPNCRSSVNAMLLTVLRCSYITVLSFILSFFIVLSASATKEGDDADQSPSGASNQAEGEEGSTSKDKNSDKGKGTGARPKTQRLQRQASSLPDGSGYEEKSWSSVAFFSGNRGESPHHFASAELVVSTLSSEQDKQTKEQDLRQTYTFTSVGEYVPVEGPYDVLSRLIHQQQLFTMTMYSLSHAQRERRGAGSNVVVSLKMGSQENNSDFDFTTFQERGDRTPQLDNRPDSLFKNNRLSSINSRIRLHHLFTRAIMSRINSRYMDFGREPADTCGSCLFCCCGVDRSDIPHDKHYSKSRLIPNASLSQFDMTAASENEVVFTNRRADVELIIRNPEYAQANNLPDIEYYFGRQISRSSSIISSWVRTFFSYMPFCCTDCYFQRQALQRQSNSDEAHEIQGVVTGADNADVAGGGLPQVTDDMHPNNTVVEEEDINEMTQLNIDDNLRGAVGGFDPKSGSGPR